MGELNKEEFNEYKTNLHRTFSKLYILKKEYNEATTEIQNATYMDCLRYGPEHPRTSINYFLMGKLFEETSRESQAEAFYGKVAEIWYKYLKTYLKMNSDEQEEQQTDSLVLEEAITFLKEIEKYFDRKYSEDNNRNLFLPIMRTEYSIGLLYKAFGQQELCREYLKEVYRRCEIFLPKNDENMIEVETDIKDLGPEYEDFAQYSPQQNKSPNNLPESEELEAGKVQEDESPMQPRAFEQEEGSLAEQEEEAEGVDEGEGEGQGGSG